MDWFALLDDAHAGRATLLTGLEDVAPVNLATIDAALEEGWAHGWHCFAWLPYGLGESHLGVRGSEQGALYWFAERVPADPDGWLSDGPAWLTDTEHDVDEATFAAAVHAIQDAIAAGTSYQVNYTHRVSSRVVGDPRALYARLRRRQPVAYGALARLPAPAAPWTLCLSPELFLHVEDGVALSRPMKGTAPATTDPDALRDDPKNRAENLMIVDLIRNDLSRVAVPGTVDVPRLFEVEPVGQLWQMTSTVRAELAPGTTPGALLAATFPCGSITGAPKLASMDLIRDTERDPRGLYTGSLGLIEPTDDPLGWSMTLNIAIRTLEIDGDSARLGIGSGIVADSTAEAEWAECHAKAAFASATTPPASLIETMRVIDGEAPLLAQHEARLESSAAALGFAPVDGLIRGAVADTPSGFWRVRIEVAPDGSTDVSRAELDDESGPVAVVLADRPWRPGLLATHKTTSRTLYDDAVRSAEARGAFDSIGYDAAGRVLEGGRSNVFALVDGRWATPPTSLGLLPGTQRAAVLADPALIGASDIVEDELTVSDLRAAEAIVVTNAVRGVLQARLEDRP